VTTIDPRSVPDPFPFEPTPTPGVSKGCRTITFAGCGLMLALVLFGGLAIVFKADQLFSWVFDQFGAQIESRLAEDVDEATRERLRHTLAEFSTAVREGKVSPEALVAAQERLAEASRAPRISEEAVLRLIGVLERAVGSAPSEAPGEPADPEPTPEVDSSPPATPSPAGLVA
jgi:hypothetical protein